VGFCIFVLDYDEEKDSLFPTLFVRKTSPAALLADSEKNRPLYFHDPATTHDTGLCRKIKFFITVIVK